nr:unnamed protein product [Digitaria exilis]
MNQNAVSATHVKREDKFFGQAVSLSMNPFRTKANDSARTATYNEGAVLSATLAARLACVRTSPRPGRATAALAAGVVKGGSPGRPSATRTAPRGARRCQPWTRRGPAPVLLLLRLSARVRAGGCGVVAVPGRRQERSLQGQASAVRPCLTALFILY